MSFRERNISLMDTPELDRIQILIRLHRHDEWDTELEGGLFRYVFDRVLTPTERIIVGEKVKGLIDGEIAVLLGSNPTTIKRHVRNIKKKYRNQMNTRVDHYQVFRRRKQQK